MSIQQLTYKLTKKYKTRNPFVIADYQRIHVRYEDLPNSVRGMAIKAKRQKYIILNGSMSDEEGRWVCAHELGHHNCHPGSSYNFIEEHSLFLPGRFEREANQFAASILIDDCIIDEGDTPEIIASKAEIPVQLVGYYKPCLLGSKYKTV